MPESTGKSLWWLTGSVLAISGAAIGIALWRESQVPSLLLLDVFDLQFVTQEPLAAFIAAVIAVLSLGLSRLVAVDQQQAALESLWAKRWIVGGLVFLFCVIGSLNVYRQAAISGDEYTNVLQTKIFAQGAFYGHWPEAVAERMAPAELGNRILLSSDGSGRIGTSYQPAFAILAAPFEKVGLRFLVNPLIAGAIVVLVGLCAWQLWQQAWIAGLAMLLMLGSASVVGFGMASFATNFLLLLHLGFIYFFMRGTLMAMVAAGITGGIALHTGNQMPHLLVAVPAVVILARGKRFRDILCLMLAYVPFIGVFSFGWTGMVQGLSQAHRQESLRGLSAAATELSWLGQHLRWPTFRQFLQDIMSLLRFSLWALPGLVGLVGLTGLAWVRMIRMTHMTRMTRKNILPGRSKTDEALQVCAIALAGAAGFYFMFPLNQGHGWGYRYMQPALGFAVLLGLSGLVRGGSSSRAVTWLMVSAGSSFAILLPLRISQISGFVADRLALLPCLPEDQPQICFVDPSRIYWGPDLIQNDPFLDLKSPLKSRLILKSLGEDSDTRLIQDLFATAKKSSQVTSPGSGSVWLPGTN